LKRSFGPIVRGTGVGAFFGVLPGTTPAIASFSSYMIEKKLGKDPSRFGQGAIEGVAGPESANNADAQCKFIPMLTLGIPASGTMALMLGALMIYGIAPGPQVMTDKPDLFWGLITSMWIGNVMLLVLNLPLIGMWVSLLKLHYRLLFPAIMAFSAIGIYSVNSSSFDIDLRRSRHCLANARLQPGADDARVRARADGRGKPTAGVAGLARRSLRVRHPADQPRVYRRYGSHLDRDGGAGGAKIVGRRLRRLIG